MNASRTPVPLAALLAALVAMGPISTDMYLPALPILARTYNASPAHVQLTLSLFLAGFALAQLAYGPLSDRFGRRPVLLGGVLLYTAASIACALAQSIDQLIVARFFQAVGACTGPVLARAVVRDLYGRERAARMLAYMGVAMGLIPAVAPILGGYVTIWFGWRGNFAALSGFGGLLVLGALFVLHETNRHRDPEATRPTRLLGNYRALVRDRRYLGYVLAAAAIYSGLFAFIQGSSFVLIEFLGVPTERFGLYFGVIVVGYIVGSAIAARMPARIGVDRMVLGGTLLAALAGLAMAGMAWLGVVGIAAIIAPHFVYMAAVGIVLPNALAGALAPFPRMAGAASALLGFVQMGLAALSGMATGLFEDGTQVPMTTAVFVMGALACAAYATLAWPRRHLAAAEEHP